MVATRSDPAPEATRTPTAVRVATSLLVVVLVTGAIGIALISIHVLGAFQDETAEHQADDVARLSERVLQWVAAGVGLWGVRRRRSIGRWLTAILALYLAVKVVSGFWGAVHAMLGQGDTVSGWTRLNTPAEGLAGVVFGGSVASGLIAIAFSMAFTPSVREYFGSATLS